MPAVSLVVCLHGEGDLLKRLLREAVGCYDDLVVVHDGPEKDSPSDIAPITRWDPPPMSLAQDFSMLCGTPVPIYRQPAETTAPTSVRAIVQQAGGRYFEGPRVFQQEPHWPFAWSQAAHDWILRLDADEFPSPELREWLIAFRRSPEPASALSMFTAIWPLWDGSRAVTHTWPKDRIFLINRRRVSFFGMVEQVPIPDGTVEATGLVLRHCPRRRSYGLKNLLLRKQAYRWRSVIAKSLLRSPVALPRWRWTDTSWPAGWEALRQRPISIGTKRMLRDSYRQLREMLTYERRILPSALLGTAFHQLLMAFTYVFYRCICRIGLIS